jgi:predicted phosphoribosyltransferase
MAHFKDVLAARVAVASLFCRESSISPMQWERKPKRSLIYVHAPACFDAVGAWYQDFEQISDQQVRALLANVQRRECRLPLTARE